MKANIQAPRDKSADCRERVAKLTLTATCEFDEAILSSIAYGLFPLSAEDSQANRLLVDVKHSTTPDAWRGLVSAALTDARSTLWVRGPPAAFNFERTSYAICDGRSWRLKNDIVQFY